MNVENLITASICVVVFGVFSILVATYIQTRRERAEFRSRYKAWLEKRRRGEPTDPDEDFYEDSADEFRYG